MKNSRALGLIALIIAAALFLVYIQPAWKGPITETRAAIRQDEDALAAARAYTERQRELATARAAIDPKQLARLTTFLPDAVDNVGLILDLNALAARSGFSLTDIDVSSRTAGTGSLAGEVSPVSSIDLSLSGAGSYAALRSFLEGIEASERLLDVQDLSVTAATTGRYVYKMTIRLYWLR